MENESVSSKLKFYLKLVILFAIGINVLQIVTSINYSIYDFLWLSFKIAIIGFSWYWLAPLAARIAREDNRDQNVAFTIAALLSFPGYFIYFFWLSIIDVIYKNKTKYGGYSS